MIIILMTIILITIILMTIILMTIILTLIILKGGRRMRVAQFLAAKCGFNEVHNVNGGIHQYAVQIDPSLPTY